MNRNTLIASRGFVFKMLEIEEQKQNIDYSDLPQFTINPRYIKTLQYFVHHFEGVVRYFYQTNGDFFKYTKAISANITLLCIIKEIEFTVDLIDNKDCFPKKFLLLNSKAPYGEIIFPCPSDGIAFINRRGKNNIPVMFSINYRGSKWYFCDFYCYVILPDGKKYAFYVN